MITVREIMKKTVLIGCVILLISIVVLYIGQKNAISILIPIGNLSFVLSVALIIGGYTWHWQRTMQFVMLIICGLLLFPIGVVLHNVAYGLAEMHKDVFVLKWLFGFLNYAGFALAHPISPVTVIVGVVGIIKTLIKKHRLKSQ